ncbi:MAG TPA: SRPBCC family protein [Cyclobacteriaceae bacterium]|nr:SRPBCC family protein [Cyclobacteriaceae bacterium]
MKRSISAGLAIVALVCCQNPAKNREQTESVKFPSQQQFVKSPIRNRIRLELNAPVLQVWGLVGNPGRMNEYSSGLERVETIFTQDGKCKEYTCYFKETEQFKPTRGHRSTIKWYEPNIGWASMDDEPNDFALTDCLTMLTFEEKGGKTILTWTQNFNSEQLDFNKQGFKLALDEIGTQLIAKFGGKFLENYVEE